MNATNFGRSKWSPQALEMLTKRRSEGASADMIAAELGVSRSAVAAKIKRLNLPLAEGVRPNFNEHSVRSRTKKSQSPIPRVVEEVLPKRESIPLKLLMNWHCRSVEGQGTDGLAVFCGAPQQVNSSWCPEHHRLFTDPERMKRHGEARPRD